MPVPSQRKYDSVHAANLDRYARDVRRAYLSVIKEVSQLGVGLNLNANDEFYWRNYPEANKKVNELIKQLNSRVYGTTVSGINTEWDLAVEKNNELAYYVYGKELDQLPAAYRTKYLSNNAAARRNFVYRKENGLGLSDKVWRNSRQFKQELELALEVGIGKGKSAESIARDVTKYLNDPDQLFRRVRDANDELRLSKAAKAYNPGRGRYRSSYKNALRLTANETNFSYEGSQREKRKQQDFIVGVEIKVSPNHNPADDKGGIPCIDLQGKYPKDFEWTYKWHVNCRCLSLNIIKTRSELDSDTEKILRGEEPNTPSKREVKRNPVSYRNWVKDNESMWENWKQPPRFVQVN